MTEMRRWTICANNRRGAEGAPMVLAGPRLDLYERVEVVPVAVVDELRDALSRLQREADHCPFVHEPQP